MSSDSSVREGSEASTKGDVSSTVGELSPLREHEQLTELLSQIPHKVQRGIKSQYEVLELTCIDANLFYIALGSSVGTVFLYDRAKLTFQRLKSESSQDVVTCVCLHHGLDDLVAVAYSSGTIYIFQLPSIMMGHSKQLERFIVSDLHEVPLKCLTWSTNGMKLYSGDIKGAVGSTEVDFYEGRCKSSILLIESNTEIVQLDQAHRSLLVSTKHRCIVCRMDDNDRIVQVGSKDRKIVGDFGACLIPAMCKPDDAQLYACRPGYRIWKSSLGGTVNNTYMFKDLVTNKHTEIPTLPFNIQNIIKPQTVNQFGPVLIYKGRELVTWSESCIYVVDPDTMTVLGSQKHMGYIKAVVITEEEIFILRAGTDRHVVRLANKPLQKSTSRLLMQLQAERRTKTGSFEGMTEESKESDKKTKTEETKPSKSKETNVTKDKTPFQMLQGNILEKVKQIPKPSVIKDKIQETFKLDYKTDRRSSYTQEYVFEKETSPSNELPPVVTLNTPGLIDLQININTSSLDLKTVSTSEGYSTLLGDFSSLSEAELSLSGTQSSVNQTGTGATSALSRLQEDHQQELSSPVYKIGNTQNEASSIKSVSASRVNKDDASIVFSRKVKIKKKKKDKEKKKSGQSNELIPEKDQDSISITSATSTHSDSSENVTPVKSHLSTGDTNCSQNIEQDELDVQEVTGTVDEATDNVDAVLDVTIESEANITIDTNSKKEITEKDNKSNETVITENSTDTILTDEKVEKASDIVTKPKIDSVNLEEAKIDSSDLNETKISPESKITVQTISDENPNFKVIPVDSEEFIKRALGSDKETNRVSNLDKELERLDSYLSEKSDNTNTDFECSTSNEIYNGQLSPNTKREAERIMFKGLHNKDKNTILTETDLKYKPSKLENELAKLEMESMAVDKQETEEQKSTQSPPQSSLKSPKPSIYSIYRSNSTSNEDFYSVYATKSPTELTPTSIDPLSTITDDNQEENKESSPESESSPNSIRISATCPPKKTFNTWTENTFQGNIYSVSVSNTHIWITDRSNNIYYSNLTGPGLTWKKATGNGSQISISRCGKIVWCLLKNTVLAGTKITARRPEGMKWVEAVKDVAYICVDETCAWYIKTSHEVMIQKGLSRDRPCYKSESVDCEHRLKQIVCQSGVVWALTENCQWLYRSGVTKQCPEGTAWKQGDSGNDNRLFSNIALGEGNLGWAVDIVGQLWFCCAVTMDTPRGDNKWWQVPFCGEYLMKDPTTLDMLKAFSKKFDTQMLSLLVSSQSGGLVAAVGGVWVCPEYKNIIHMCRGSIEGQIWTDAHPLNLAASSVWKIVAARNATLENAIIWAQQPNSDIFTFTVDRQMCTSIAGPTDQPMSVMFVCMSVCADALWGLTTDGDVYIRTGMSKDQPTGSGWAKLDLSQIDDSMLVHVSCGQLNVWAVDSDGRMFHRIGVKAPSDHSLNAAWLPVDNGGTVFTHVVVGQQDWKVWAIDNRRQVYVRVGITSEMPIGQKWVHVSGSQAMQLTVSDHYVWALNHAGELLCRYNVSMENPAGDYWKKIPGSLNFISASPDNNVWGTSTEGHMVRRHTRYILKNTGDQPSTDKQGSGTRATSISSEDGWELV